MDKAYVHFVALLGVIGLSLAVIIPNLSLPYVWLYDYPSAHHSVNAKNHLNYGLGVTRGGLVRNGNPEVPEKLIFSSHHPPLLPLIVAASYATFGVSEAVGRGTMMSFAMANVLLLYWLVRVCIGARVALVASLTFALLPLQLFYATKINHEPVVLTFVLGSLISYFYWRRSPSLRGLAVLVAVFSIGTMVDWAAYYIGGLIPAFHFLDKLYRRERIDRSDYTILALPVFGVLMFLLFVLHLYSIDPELARGLSHLAEQRSGMDQDYNQELFTNIGLLGRTTTRASGLFTLPAVSVAITGLLLVLSGLWSKTEDRNPDLTFLLLLWFVGATHLVVFRHVSWVHEFLVYYLMVPVAVTASWTLVQIRSHISRRSGFALFILFALVFGTNALYKARDLFWTGHITGILPLAEFIKSEVPPNGIVLSTDTHHPFLHPGVEHYAERDVIHGVVTQAEVSEMQKVHKSPLYLLILGEPSSDPKQIAPLSQWISERSEGVTSQWGSLYLIPRGDQSDSG